MHLPGGPLVVKRLRQLGVEVQITAAAA